MVTSRHKLVVIAPDRASTALWFVIPCYNEQEVLAHSIQQVFLTLQQLSFSQLCDPERSGLLLVDDGSTDQSWAIIERLVDQYRQLRALRLSRNRGHQTALLAGLLEVADFADHCISLDADLQDDLAVCARMLQLAQTGVDIVYGVRHQRQVDSPTKRLWAILFYRFAPRLGLQGVEGHADFRLLSSRALHAIADYPERSLYLRGLIPLLGFSSCCVTYERQPRSSGTSKYPFRKSLSLALDAIISLSDYPLRLIAWSGLGAALASMVAMGALIFRHLIGGTVHGWTSIMVAIVGATGFQMLALGVIGEYLARVYAEVKRRPRYHVQARIGG